MATDFQTGDPIKLRKSCDSCATTKVGCSKEKPVCSRCAKRGLFCSYSTAKRVGRTAKKHAQIPSLITGTPPGTDSDAVPVDSWRHNIDSVLQFGSTAQQSPVYTQDQLVTDYFGPQQSASTTAIPTSTNAFTDFDEMWASMLDSSLEGLEDTDDFEASLINSRLNSIDSSNFGSDDYTASSSRSSSLLPTPMPMLNDRVSSRGSVAATSTSGMEFWQSNMDPMSAAAASAVLLTSNSSGSSSPSCHCLAQAVGLSAGFSARTVNSDGYASGDLTEFEAAMTQNEQTSNHIWSILQCSCPHDSDLIVSLSLLLFKVIAWYTSASQALMPSRRSASSSTLPRSQDARYEAESRKRMAMQIILCKLAGVQALVEKVSNRLQLAAGGTADDAFERGGRSQLTGRSTTGLSPETARTLQMDLRKRLYDLSQGIISRLRYS